MNDWKIDRVRACCCACERAFEENQRVVSVIEPQPDESLVRRDYCTACAAQGKVGFYWETRWNAPAQKKKRLDFGLLLRLFEAWLEKPPAGTASLLYLIALLLIRKRLFRLLDLVTHEGSEYLRLRRPGPEQKPFLVPAPLLPRDQLPELREKLEGILDGVVEDTDFDALAGPDAEDAVPRP